MSICFTTPSASFVSHLWSTSTLATFSACPVTALNHASHLPYRAIMRSTYILLGPARTSRTPCHPLALRGLHREGPRWVPALMCLLFTVSTGLVVPQNHHTDHREHAANAATAEPTSGFELDLRYLWTCWQSLTREAYGRGRCEGDWRRWSSLLQHDDQDHEHHHEGEILDQSRGRPIVFSFCIQTGQRDRLSAFGSWIPICTSNSTCELSLMECSHPALLVDVVSNFPEGGYSCEENWELGAAYFWVVFPFKCHQECWPWSLESTRRIVPRLSATSTLNGSSRRHEARCISTLRFIE